MYPLKHLIVAPRASDDILPVCADLIREAVSKAHGKLLVFLPGMDEIQRLQKILENKQVFGDPELNIIRLHSDLLGEGENSQDNAESRNNWYGRRVYLSSLVVARGVTLPDIKYVFIHPYCRTTVLHQSGLDALGEQRIDAELMANMTGRGGRTASGLVFYL